jgi:hypothetical protein
VFDVAFSSGTVVRVAASDELDAFTWANDCIKSERDIQSVIKNRTSRYVLSINNEGEIL